MIHIIYKTISPSGKYYIGRHSTSDLNDGYLGSGKWVRSVNDKSSLTREILAYANSFDELKLLEEQFISKHIDDPNNMNFNDKSVGFPTGDLNWNRTEDAKLIKRERKLGVSMEEEYGVEKAKLIKEKIASSMRGASNPNFGKIARNRGIPHSIQTREKMSKSVSEWMTSMTPDERREKFGNKAEANGFFNKQHSSDTIEYLKIKQQSLRQTNRHTCPHCGKNIDAANFARYHGDKCKLK